MCIRDSLRHLLVHDRGQDRIEHARAQAGQGHRHRERQGRVGEGGHHVPGRPGEQEGRREHRAAREALAPHPVEQGAQQGEAAEEGDHQADGGGAAEGLPAVHRQQDRGPALVQPVGHHDHHRDAQQQPGTGHEGPALGEFGAVRLEGHLPGGALRFGGRHPAQEDGDQQCRRPEGRRVQQQYGLGAEHGDEQAGHRGPDHPGAARDRVVEAGSAGDGGSGVLGEIRQEHGAGGQARGVHQASDGHQCAQHPELQHARVVQQRDRADRQAADQVGGDGDPAAADPVDDRSADQRGHDDGQGGAEGDDAGPAGAARGVQHEERDTDEGE